MNHSLGLFLLPFGLPRFFGSAFGAASFLGAAALPGRRCGFRCTGVPCQPPTMMPISSRIVVPAVPIIMCSMRLIRMMVSLQRSAHTASCGSSALTEVTAFAWLGRPGYIIKAGGAGSDIAQSLPVVDLSLRHRMSDASQ